MMEKKKRKPIMAAILSSLSPGLGQLYNGQIIKGIIFLLSLILLPIIMFRIGLHYSFYGLAFILLISMFFLLFIIGEGFFTAIKKKEFILKPYNKLYIYLLIILLINSFVLIPKNFLMNKVLGLSSYKLPTGSMEPTLSIGDYLVTDSKYFKKNELQRGDLVVFQSPEDPAKIFIKRIIALEGEKIEIKSKQVYIDDIPFPEGYKLHLDNKVYPGRDNFGPVIVPSDHCFVLGDNRDKSMDSRHWDSLLIKNIKGKPLYIYWARDITRIGMKIK
ncbi:MAG TPA: signal peptidase I [Candidatus Aminicenantes bacterium]|nr:signal peptidase I [Candidatus Aminicenantes bacterium]